MVEGAHILRAHQEAAAAARNSGAKFAMADEPPTTDGDPIEFEDSHGARSSAPERIFTGFEAWSNT